MSWPTSLRLAVAGGRGDATRIALTALGAAAGAVALDSAVTVAVTGAGNGHPDGPYSSDVLNQPGLHPGVVVALVLLCLPVLAFAGQCARVGAPARDRRLAALRLGGATPRDVARVAASETGLSAALGAGAGTGAYFVLRVLLGHPEITTYEREQVHRTPGGLETLVAPAHGPVLRLPTDVLPPWPALMAVALAIPVVAAALTVLALRRVTISPFGVVRREQQRPVRALPAVLFLAGTAGLAAFAAVRSALHLGPHQARSSGVLLLALMAMTGWGLLQGAGALSAAIGAATARRTRHPSVLLAGRRLLAAPTQASRSHAALLLVVLLWSFTQGVRVWMLTTVSSDAAFYADALDLVDLAFAVGAGVAAASLLVGAVEGVVSRRRALAAMSAAGVPRGVLHRAVLLETLLPLVPTTVLAACAGILAARGLLGSSAEVTTFAASGRATHHLVHLPVPWTALGVLTGGSLLAAAMATAVALPVLRSSTDPAELRAS